MLLTVDPTSSASIHEQLTGQLRGSIARGDLAPGTWLPPARELAEGLDVNVHTVLRAFAAIRDEGLVEMRRGKGTVVTGQAPAVAPASRLARELVVAARRVGLSDTAIRSLVEAHL